MDFHALIQVRLRHAAACFIFRQLFATTIYNFLRQLFISFNFPVCFFEMIFFFHTRARDRTTTTILFRTWRRPRLRRGFYKVLLMLNWCTSYVYAIKTRRTNPRFLPQTRDCSYNKEKSLLFNPATLPPQPAPPPDCPGRCCCRCCCCCWPPMLSPWNMPPTSPAILLAIDAICSRMVWILAVKRPARPYKSAIQN